MENSVCTGDLITFYIEGKGYLGMGPVESSSPQSNFAPKMINKPDRMTFPSNFATLCVFEILLVYDHKTKGSNRNF